MPPVAILRLFDSTGTDISMHIALVAGKMDRVEVRLFAADGTTRITGGVKLAFTFSPTSLAQAAPLDTLIWTLTPTAPPDSSGSLSITVTQPTNSTPIQKFGPFQALVHPGS